LKKTHSNAKIEFSLWHLSLAEDANERSRVSFIFNYFSLLSFFSVYFSKWNFYGHSHSLFQ